MEERIEMSCILFVKKDGRFVNEELVYRDKVNKVYVLADDILFVECDSDGSGYVINGCMFESGKVKLVGCPEAKYFGSYCRRISYADIYCYGEDAWLIEAHDRGGCEKWSYRRIDNYEFCAMDSINIYSRYVFNKYSLFDLVEGKFVYKGDKYVDTDLVVSAINNNKVAVLQLLVKLDRKRVGSLKVSTVLRGYRKYSLDRIEKFLNSDRAAEYIITGDSVPIANLRKIVRLMDMVNVSEVKNVEKSIAIYVYKYAVRVYYANLLFAEYDFRANVLGREPEELVKFFSKYSLSRQLSENERLIWAKFLKQVGAKIVWDN